MRVLAAIAALVLAGVLASLLYFGPGRAETSPAAIESVEELLGVARRSLPCHLEPREAFYLVNLSGRVVEINAGRIPGLRGLQLGDFCVLAYVNGSWIDLPFTVYDRKVRPPNSSMVFYETPKSVGPRSRIALKMPALPPSSVDPLKNTPPQARGATRWGWLLVSLPGSRYSYPLLIVAGSPQIRRTCGEYPLQFTQNRLDIVDWLEAPETPWPLEQALREGYRVSERVVVALLRPITVEARLAGGHGLSPGSIGRPLPDGGGGGGGGEEATVVMLETLAVRRFEGNTVTWRELVLNVTPESPRLFHVYPYSPNGGVQQGDVAWTKIEVTLYPTPLGGYDGVSEVLLTIYPESPYEVTKTATISPYTASVAFTYTPPQNPYGSSDDSIPFKVAVYDGEWAMTVRVRVHIKWTNYQSYIPEKVKLPVSVNLFREMAGDFGGIAAIWINGGVYNSSAAFPVAIPGEIAILREPDDLAAPAVGATFRVRLPPGFPGGNLTIQVPGFWPCTKSLPSAGAGGREVLIGCVFVCVPEETLVPAYSRGVSFGWALVELSEPLSMPDIVYIDLASPVSADRLDLKGLPLVPIVHPDASESYGNTILTPIIDYYEPSKFATKTIMRLSTLWNERLRTGSFSRWAPLLLTVSQRSGNLYSTMALHPWSMELYSGGTTYRGVGRITSFTLNLTLTGPEACSGGTGDISVYGLTAEGGLLGVLEQYLHIARKVVDYASKVIDSLKTVASALNVVDLAIHYRSIVDVETGRACSGAGRLYLWASADNTGWWPDGFENVITVRFYDALPGTQPESCYHVAAHITVSTEYITWLEDDITPAARVCQPFAWGG